MPIRSTLRKLRRGKEIVWLDVKTNIEEEDYPSNANMVKGLREYFEGTGDESALDIFEALLPQLTCKTKRCRQKEVKDLLQLLKAKDRLRIAKQCQKMLKSKGVGCLTCWVSILINTARILEPATIRLERASLQIFRILGRRIVLLFGLEPFVPSIAGFLCRPSQQGGHIG